MSETTYVSFYLGSNTIRIFKSTVRFLGTPKFIQFRVNGDLSSLILVPQSKNSLTNHRVSQNIYAVTGSMEIHSKALCGLLAARCHWDTQRSYRVPGKLIDAQKIVLFDLSKATEIPQSNPVFLQI